MFRERIIFVLIFPVVLLLSACGADSPVAEASPTPGITRVGTLPPFNTPTTTATPTPTNAGSPTPLPSPTPTLRSHVIQRGDDLFGIAWRYRVSLEDLMAANPTVNPNLLSIDTVLTIPNATTPMPEAAGSIPSPTPLPVEAERVVCYLTEEGGAWCFQTITNQTGQPIEGLTAIFRMADPQAEEIVPVQAVLPLNILPAGDSLPLYAYFAPPLPDPFVVSGEILSALPGQLEGRYIATRLENQQVMLSEDRLSAQINANLSLEAPDALAQRLWVAVVAYDIEGNIVGVRRWENENAQPLESGQAVEIQTFVYSAAGEIDQVRLIAEAQP